MIDKLFVFNYNKQMLIVASKIFTYPPIDKHGKVMWEERQ